MAVPKRKTTPSRRNMRRSHHSLESTNIVTNSKTGEFQRPHHISLKDGYYGDKQVLIPKHIRRADKKKSST